MILETHDIGLLDDLCSFDSFMPGIFGPTGLFDLSQDPSMDIPALMSIPKTPPPIGPERAIDSRAHDQCQDDPLMNTVDPPTTNSAPRHGSPSITDRNSPQRSISPRPQLDPAALNFSPRDHDWLLEMCMSFVLKSWSHCYWSLTIKQMTMSSAYFL